MSEGPEHPGSVTEEIVRQMRELIGVFGASLKMGLYLSRESYCRLRQEPSVACPWEMDEIFGMKLTIVRVPGEKGDVLVLPVERDAVAMLLMRSGWRP